MNPKHRLSLAALVSVLVWLLVPTSSQGDDAPNATISTKQLKTYSTQPEKVKQVIRILLDLTKQDLTYQFGSADPARGGMDCSGTMHHALSQAGFEDVPRMAHQQYRWIWEKGRFHAVLSHDLETFELDRLRPGDMLFWSGTYQVERDPPVTHAMIFLGWLKDSGKPVMAGASNGRTYEGKRRNGVSVFDFRLPRKGSPSRFVGYGSLPGVRRDAPDKKDAQASAPGEG